MYDFTQLTPTVLTLISGRRIPVTKVTEMRWWSKLGGDGRPTVPNHRAVRKARRLGFCIDQDPPMGSPFGSQPCEEMVIFDARLYQPDATAAAGPPVRLGSWLTSALARAGRELSRAILGSPRDQRTAEEGLPQWPLANKACLTRYMYGL